jgi:hypothetical protein
MRRIVCVIVVLCSCVLAVPARAQQQQEPEDPEDEKQIGLWLDQGIPPAFRRTNLWMSNSTSGSTRERPTCSSTSFKALPSVRGRGSR